MPATGTTNSNNNTNSSTLPQKINNSQPHSPSENHFNGLISQNSVPLNFTNVLPKSHEQTALLGKRPYKQLELESESSLKKFRKDTIGSQFNNHNELPTMLLNSDSCNSNSQNSKHHKHKRHKSGRKMKDVIPLPAHVFIKNTEPFVISDSISDEASMCEFPSAYQQHNKIVEPPRPRPPRELSFKGCFSKDPVAQPLEPLPKVKKRHSNHNSISSMLSGGDSSNGIVSFQSHNSNSNLELFGSYTTTTMSLSKQSTPPAVETPPKKRSFKKGLNLETQKMTVGATCVDIKQKIASSASRKGKTTKELLAELQSRKLMAAGLCPDIINIPKSPSSSSHSASERIRSPEQPKTIVPLRKTALNAIDDEIRELHRRLKPIHDAFNDDYDEEHNIKCTCTWREVIEEIEVIESVKNEVKIIPELNGHLNNDTDSDDDDDDFCAVVNEPLEILKPKSIVKSIFDLDYDPDDDPILNITIIKSPPLQQNQIKRKDKIVKKFVPLPVKAEVPVIDNQLEFKPPPIVKWECDEDPDCPARLHFNKFTAINDFHVRALHDKFIPTVNGNWNGLSKDALAEPEPNKYELKYEHPDIRYEHHGLWKRVVPSYNHLIMEKLPKTFSQLNGNYNNDDNKPMKSETINNGQLPSFNNLNTTNLNGINNVKSTDFKEWYELMNVPSYNDSEILTILPYVVID